MSHNNIYKDFPKCIEKYFLRYLLQDRGLSTKTIASYSTTFSLLITYLNDKKNILPEKLTFDCVDRETILNFLQWLKDARCCCTRSCNQRLAAIKSFYKFMMYEDTSHMDEWKQILAISQRKDAKKVVQYLSVSEVKELLNKIPIETINGRRELTILSLLYNSAMRVSELTNLKVSSVRGDEYNVIEVHGKGNKRRLIPINKDMAGLLKEYMMEHGLNAPAMESHPLFYNYRKEPLSDEGINYILNKYVRLAKAEHNDMFSFKITPHILRHSRAVHWLMAGIDITYLRDLMGHVSVQTTEIYAKVDSKAKKEALEKAWNIIGITEPETAGWENKPKLLAFLESFKK